MTEELFATRTRLFVETSPGNATPSGDVIEAPFTSAVASRIGDYIEEKVTPFGHRQGREAVLESMGINATFHVGAAFLAFILEPHLTGGTALDYRSPRPTFALQLESKDGDLIQFDGLAISDLQLSFVARGVVNLSLNLLGFKRTTGVTLEAVTATLDSTPLAGNEVVIAAKSGALSPFPQTSDKGNASAAEFFLRRTLQASQFNADGVPTRHDSGPWRAFGEVVVPADSFTETATGTFVDGSAAFFLGELGSNLSLFLDDSVRWLSSTDPIKANDFRDYRVLFEGGANPAGQLLTLSNNLP
jgi:hypothetical protein